MNDPLSLVDPLGLDPTETCLEDIDGNPIACSISDSVTVTADVDVIAYNPSFGGGADGRSPSEVPLIYLGGKRGGGKKRYSVNLKVLNDCLTKMGIKTTIDSFTPSTPGGSGSASGVGEDHFSGRGNAVPIAVTNDAHTYSFAQISAMFDRPTFGFTDPTNPYTNYTNNNNNAFGTVDTQVWELGNSPWVIQAGSSFIPVPGGDKEPGNVLEKCIRANHGIQAQ